MGLGLRVGLLFLLRGIFLGGALLLRGILPAAEDGAGGVIAGVWEGVPSKADQRPGLLSWSLSERPTVDREQVPKL